MDYGMYVVEARRCRHTPSIFARALRLSPPLPPFLSSTPRPFTSRARIFTPGRLGKIAGRTLATKKKFLEEKVPGFEILLGRKVWIRMSTSTTRKNAKSDFKHDILMRDPDEIEAAATLTPETLYDLLDPTMLDLYAAASMIRANEDFPREVDEGRRRVQALGAENVVSYFAPDVVSPPFRAIRVKRSLTNFPIALPAHTSRHTHRTDAESRR